MLSGMIFPRPSLCSLRTESLSPVGSGTTTQEMLRGTSAKQMLHLSGSLLPGWGVFGFSTVLPSRVYER